MAVEGASQLRLKLRWPFYVGWATMVFLFGIIAFFIIATIFFGYESAPRCNEFICYREY